LLTKSVNRTVLIAANSSWNLANFRRPIIAALQERGFTVIAAVPDDEGAEALSALGVDIEPVSMNPRGLSPMADLGLLLQYRRLMKRLTPAAFLPFTAKPNIYGSVAAGRQGVPVINTITGLGTGFLSGRGLKAVMSGLYRFALRSSHRVFFHNSDDRDLFVARGLVRPNQAAVVAGSGVDLEHFAPSSPRAADSAITFLFIGRLLRDKGAAEFVGAAAIVKSRRRANFQMLGSYEPHPKAVGSAEIEEWRRTGVVELLGSTDDVRPFIAKADCVVLPSYREGLPRALLEASAMGKPVIACDVPGCRHAVEDGVTGLLCEARSVQALAKTMIAFLDLDPAEREAMGRSGRGKAEREFSEQSVVAAYLAALNEAGLD
jgi:glycosyltransferase involved in cell wall biosynthesis